MEGGTNSIQEANLFTPNAFKDTIKNYEIKIEEIRKSIESTSGNNLLKNDYSVGEVDEHFAATRTAKKHMNTHRYTGQSGIKYTSYPVKQKKRIETALTRKEKEILRSLIRDEVENYRKQIDHKYHNTHNCKVRN
jgi:hypothetical protein